MDLPPEVAEGDEYPGAGWFAALRRYLRSARITVARGSGLTLIQAPGGQVLSFNPGPLPRFAITTTSFDAYNPSTKKLGVGKVALHRIKATPSGWNLVPVGGPAVDAGSGDPAGVGSGVLVQVKTIDGLPVIDVQYCSAGT